MLREELQLLQEQGSYVGEVVKPMDKKKVLVKVIGAFKSKAQGCVKVCIQPVEKRYERSCVHFNENYSNNELYT